MATSVAPAPAPASALGVFRNRSFTLLWTGQLVSNAGSALTSLAASILVYRLTGSALSVGLMLMATALPTLFVGLIAGVFVDRYDRKRIMIITDLIRMVLIALLPTLIPLNVAFLYIIVALSSAVGQFFEPAYSSVLPEIASDEHLAAANSMMTISSIGAQAIGFAGAGFLASLFNLSIAFYIDAFTFLFSAACVLLARIPSPKVEGKTNIPTIVRNLKAGGQVILSTPSLRSLFLVYLPVFIVYGLNNSLTLPFARRALGASEFQYSLIEGISMAGIVIGSLVMARLADRLREGQWISISFIGMALMGILYSTLISVPLAIVVSMAAATLNAPSVIGRQLLIQRNTPRDTRGRVFSAFYVLRDTMFMVGMAMVALADVFDVRLVFFTQAFAFLCIGSLALVLPGLGQPAAQWRRAISLLRGAKAAPGLGPIRPLTLADMDLLVARLPALGGLSESMHQTLLAHAAVTDAPAGTTILRKGDKSDAAYFVLSGQAVAGQDEQGGYRVLEVLNAGDFFGEIAALTGTPRTANVVAQQPVSLVQVPAVTLRQMMSDDNLRRLFMSKMTERMVRMRMIDIPRLGGIDQATLRDLRTPEPETQQPTPVTAP